MPFSDTEMRDIERRFVSSYISIQNTKDGTIIPLFLQGIIRESQGELGLHGYIREETGKENKKGIIIGSGRRTTAVFSTSQYDILPAPKACVFDALGVSMVYTRKSERQWQRGVSPNNSMINVPLLDFIMAMQNKSYKVVKGFQDVFSLQAVGNLLTPNYTSLKQALEEMRSLRLLSRCVTKENFVSYSVDEGEYLLWRMDRPIAKFRPDTNTAEVLVPFYAQEVADFFNREGENYAIN